MHFLGTAVVHLLADDALDVALDAPADRRETVEASGQGGHKTGAEEQLVAAELGLRRGISQGFQHQLAHAHGQGASGLVQSA
jgi:hypothetical protein